MRTISNDLERRRATVRSVARRPSGHSRLDPASGAPRLPTVPGPATEEQWRSLLTGDSPAVTGCAAPSGRSRPRRTALGDPVNTAARLAQLAAAGKVLVSDEVAALAGFDTTPWSHRTVDVRGRDATLDVTVVTAARAAATDPAIPTGEG
jgi:hypothetical protein